jgi:uncharacterized glyoxalase superfamily protein PhnB
MLCQTFGFEKHLVVPNEDGTIAHAQLSFGNGMVMLGSVLKDETEFGRLMKQPDEIGGAGTQAAYVVVNDADAVYARAKAAGAKIVIEIKDKTTAVAASDAMTSKAISGVSGPTIRGDVSHATQ